MAELSPIDFELFRACRELDQAGLVAALKNGASATARGPDGEGPLHVCAFHSNLYGIVTLVKHGAAVNLNERYRGTPLHVAAFTGNIDCVRLLLNFGAKKEAKSLKGKTPVDVAKTSAIRNLLTAWTGGGDNETLLHLAAYTNDLELATLLVTVANVDVNALDRFGVAPLHLASLHGFANIVRLLLDHGADRTLRTHKGNLPIDVARTPVVAAMLQENSGPTGSFDGRSATPVLDRRQAAKQHAQMVATRNEWQRAGFMSREGKLKKWKRRYVVIEEKGARTKLAYFKSTADKNPLGVVRLAGARVETTAARGGQPGHHFTLFADKSVLQSGQQAVHHFYVDSVEERNLWLQAIRAAATFARQQPLSDRAYPPSPALSPARPRAPLYAQRLMAPLLLQNANRISLRFAVPPHTDEKFLSVQIEPRHITVGLRGSAPVTDGELYASVLPTMCRHWIEESDEGTFAHVELEKAKPGEWPSLCVEKKGDADEEESSSEGSVLSDSDEWSDNEDADVHAVDALVAQRQRRAAKRSAKGDTPPEPVPRPPKSAAAAVMGKKKREKRATWAPGDIGKKKSDGGVGGSGGDSKVDDEFDMFVRERVSSSPTTNSSANTAASLTASSGSAQMNMSTSAYGAASSGAEAMNANANVATAPITFVRRQRAGTSQQRLSMQLQPSNDLFSLLGGANTSAPRSTSPLAPSGGSAGRTSPLANSSGSAMPVKTPFNPFAPETKTTAAMFDPFA